MQTKLQPVGNTYLTFYDPTTDRQYSLVLLTTGKGPAEFILYGGAREEGGQVLKHTGSPESCLEEFLYWCRQLHEHPEKTLEVP
jgi:hypothetical protein